MAGAIEKKINDVVSELKDAPNTHIDARAAILDAITLSREFSNTYLDALCKEYTSASGSYSLHEICVALAKQRNLCFGGKAIRDNSSYFDLPTHSKINGSLDLTEPSKTSFGIKATNLFETDTINLSNIDGATQTIDGNTFSTYIKDYYLVRSRVSGELEPTSGNLSAYTTPDGGDVVFGNAIAWVDGTGGNIATEQEANTWNYHWAKANLASVTTNNSGAWNELTVLTLSDVLTQGSNTDYTPVGPSFNNKYYLKRQADHVNTFTITGTTTVNSAAVTDISEADLAKVKHGDVISGTGIPDDNVTILAVQTEQSTIRLSETGVATETGTITLTVNSVPVGHAAHDIFCQVQVVGEGLVKNDNWKPIGDGNGDYSGANEGADELLVASTSQFIGLLGFFDPNNAGSDDLIKAASGAWVSEGKEYNDINYPDIIRNPIFPANAGTNKTYERKPDNSTGEIIGTQPTGLGDSDVWCGRFVAWNKGRENAAGPVSEYRYKIDNAEKYFYAPPSNLGYNYGTTSVAADSMHPLAAAGGGESEPRNICPRQGMSTIVSRVTSTTTTHANDSSATVIPGDAQICYNNTTSGTGPTTAATGGFPGTGDRNGSIGTFYVLEANNMITVNHVHVTIDVTTTSTGTTHTLAYENRLDGVFDCRYNHVQKHLYEAGSANTDMAFIMDTVSQLKALDHFRDPVTTGTAAPRAASGGTAGNAGGTSDPGISDADFETYLNSAGGPEGDYNALNTCLTKFREAFIASGRVSKAIPGSGNWPRCIAAGSSVDFSSFTQDSVAYNGVTLWGNFSTELNTFKDNCDKRVREIDARIGVPTYSGAAASRGTPPTIRVSAIPSSPAAGSVLPYGRAIFNGVNHLLGRDVDLLGGIIKEVESLTDLINLVKKARNKYDIFNGRDKVYPV